MTMELERFSVSGRPEVAVGLQGATAQGAGKEDGVSYADPGEDGVYGPYETGCEEGRKCYEVAMQRQRTGLLVTVRLAERIPLSGLVGWWRADALAGYGDGQAITSWPASLGGYPLEPLTGVLPRYREDRINGLPAAGSTSDEFEGVGMALQTGLHFAGTGQGRQLVVVAKIPAFAYGHLDMTGEVYMSGLDFNGWSAGYFDGVYVAGDLWDYYANGVRAARSTDWSIVSARFALSRSAFSLRSNGGELAAQLELEGNAALARESEDRFYVHLGIEYGESLEVAEVLAWDRGLADAEIARVERYLADKYAIALAETS